VLADDKLGQEIIDKVARLSASRATEVKWVDGRAVITVGYLVRAPIAPRLHFSINKWAHPLALN
jgi:hypothetical protein